MSFELLGGQIGGAVVSAVEGAPSPLEHSNCDDMHAGVDILGDGQLNRPPQHMPITSRFSALTELACGRHIRLALEG